MDISGYIYLLLGIISIIYILLIVYPNNIIKTRLQTLINKTIKEIEKEKKILYEKYYSNTEINPFFDNTIKRLKKLSKKVSKYSIFSLKLGYLYFLFKKYIKNKKKFEKETNIKIQNIETLEKEVLLFFENSK